MFGSMKRGLGTVLAPFLDIEVIPGHKRISEDPRV